MRVVRVSTDDAQRIVGIEIPQDRVGVVLRTIGSERDLREPDEILKGILDEGEEITLVSNLKLRRGLIHREPAVELCGAGPYKFAELRELGLLNEQISWKQRFFIPTDKTTGVEILSALLDRYPVVLPEEAGNETEASAIELAAPIDTTNIVDLERWIIAAEETNAANETATEIDLQIERGTLAPAGPPENVPAREPTEVTPFTLAQQNVPCLGWGMRPSAIQLAFEFA